MGQQVQTAAAGPGFPAYSVAERTADAGVHAASLVLGAIAATWLVRTQGPPLQHVGLTVYAAGMLTMLMASAAYNLAAPGRLKEELRRIDHAAIFAAIAGTYTPLLLTRLGGPAALVACAAVWLCAGAGALLKLVAPRRWERVGLGLCLALGWAWLPAAGPLAQLLQVRTAALMLAGMLLYTVGAGVHAVGRMPFHNALWHALVLAAAATHFGAIATELALL
jgi:hemolysin III